MCDKLKPCPFCGSEPIIKQSGDAITYVKMPETYQAPTGGIMKCKEINREESWNVTCPKRHASINGNSRTNAMAAWNRRFEQNK